MEFLFAHTERYPEEAPCIKLQPVYGLSDSEVATCFSKLQEEVDSNIGMAMIYTLITAAKEWLRGGFACNVQLWLSDKVFNSFNMAGCIYLSCIV